MHETEAPYIAVIGGGTGSSTLLAELKQHTPNLSAVVNMSDDGGSSGRLRDALGVMPPGDVRQCLTALSGNPVMGDIFAHRFGGEGTVAGHTYGNLLLASLELQDDFASAVKAASKILEITGCVIPVTLDNHTLVMDDGDETVRGEFLIAHRKIQHQDARVRLEPQATLSQDAEEAIYGADQIVIAPGNLYGSILPALMVDGMREAFNDSPAQKVAIANLMTKPGQTDDWHVLDYIEKYEEHIGPIDTVLYNNHLLEDSSLKASVADGEQQVGFDPARFASRPDISAIGDDFVNNKLYQQDPNDTAIRRTAVRHNAAKISQQLARLAQGS